MYNLPILALGSNFATQKHCGVNSLNNLLHESIYYDSDTFIKATRTQFHTYVNEKHPNLSTEFKLCNTEALCGQSP